MARTTINIEDPLLHELKKLQKMEGKSLGRVVSEMVALGLESRKSSAQEPVEFHWLARPLGARVDLNDKDALYALLDE